MTEHDDKFKYCIVDKPEEWYEIFIRRLKNPKKRILHKKIGKRYYDKYKDIYEYLYKKNIFNHPNYKRSSTYGIDKYIMKNTNYNGVSKLLQLYKYKELKNRIPNPKKLQTIIIHKPIIPNINFKNKKTFGTFVDYCIRKIINNTTSPLKYLKTCKIYNTLPQNIHEINDEFELMNKVISPNFINIIKDKFIALFKDEKMECGKFAFHNKLEIYGEPDIITDSTIIDIKLVDKLNTTTNYLQILLYAITCNRKNICLYNPINGTMIKTKISNTIKRNIIKYHVETILDMRIINLDYEIINDLNVKPERKQIKMNKIRDKSKERNGFIQTDITSFFKKRHNYN